ncbi:MAG TPA: LLM class flavin-dependent oxidoreductase [Candidatus Binatia bacterium]|nr:LLM class flavin-dependent oxidoreductase [Candidatus Binatia bacterium]
MKIRIGYAYGGQGVRPGTAAGYASLVDGLEELGFDSLWLTERLNADTLDPVAALGFAAGRTRKLKLGTAVMVLPGRNPVVLAKELATLDQLAEGRLLPAFGLGVVDAREQQGFGVHRSERAEWFEEALPLLRRLWAEDEVTHEGPRFHLEGVAVRPKPVNRAIDVWLGGAQPRELERVGRLSDGWLPSFLLPSEAAAGRRIVEQAAADAGREIEDEHFGALIQYSLTPLTGEQRDRITLRRRRIGPVDPDELVPVGGPAVRRRVEEFISAGVAKFVLTPARQPDAWEPELAEVAEHVLPLQTRAD